MYRAKTEQAKERVEQLRNQLREELEGEVRTRGRAKLWQQFFRRCSGCCGVYLIILLVVAGAVSYAVAKTGYVRIPVMSALVEHTTEPVHVVRPGDGDIDRIFANALLRSLVPRGDGSMGGVIELSDSEMTGALRRALDGQEQVHARTAETIQIAATSEAIELFALVPGYGEAESSIRIRGVPTIENGVIEMDLLDVQFGGMPVPTVFIEPVVNAHLRRLSALADAGEIPVVFERLTLGDRSLSLELHSALQASRRLDAFVDPSALGSFIPDDFDIDPAMLETVLERPEILDAILDDPELTQRLLESVR